MQRTGHAASAERHGGDGPVRRDLRGERVGGGGAVWASAVQLAEGLSGIAPRHPLARHLRAGLCPLGRRAVRAELSLLGACRGPIKVDERSEEITAIPHLLRLLDVLGCLVTVDALGCQKEIAAQIVA